VNDEFYLQTSRVEDDHWWFRHRRRLVDALLRAECPAAPARRGLDVGCGSGGNLELLSRHCEEIVGLDRSALALRLAREKRPASLLVQGDANQLADLFPEDSFHLITSFNVLYHQWISDERTVLRQIARLLRPGGCLVLTEPAFRLLFRRHDVVDWGRRRYRLGELRRFVDAAQLSVRRSSYFNSVAFLPALAVATVQRGLGRLDRGAAAEQELKELVLPNPLINRLLVALLGVESRWIRHFGRMPIGVGAMILARKRQ
jgi:SAM-dependent methyltransferase